MQFSRDQLMSIGSIVAEEVQRQIRRHGLAILAYEAEVATEAVIGTPAIRSMDSPNGDTIQEAAVWFGVPDDQKSADTAVWCPVARHVTGLTEGDRVRVCRNDSRSEDWTVDMRR